MDFALMLVGEVFGVERETSLQIFVGLITLFFAFIIGFTLFLRRKPSKKTILIAGPSDSGKTLIFSNLITNNAANPMTVTSQKENLFDEYENENGKSLRLIDVPGAEKIRSSILEVNSKKFPPISGLIYVLDSGAVVKDCRETAEYLYELLADSQAIAERRHFPVLVVCNKQDSPTAKSAKVIKSTLEKEFTLLNRTRAAALVEAGTDDNRKRILAESESEFSFKLVPQKIDFVESTAKRGGGRSSGNVNIVSVVNWLNSF